MNQPLVSVIIPNYNYGRFISEAIDSVLAQTYPNIEIIVVDDGSTDNSLDMLRGYGEQITLIRQKNQKVSRARNNGVAKSTGDLIAFLDADDVWLPEKIEKQVKLFLDNAEMGLVHCGVVDVDLFGNDLIEHLDGMEGNVAEEMLRYRRNVILGGGSAVVVKRTLFEKVGGFDINLRVSEDWELYYQIAKQSKVGFIAEVLVKYRIHTNNNFVNNPESVKRMDKDMMFAYEKIFADEDNDLQKIKNDCFGRAHTIIAGSYFRIGKYGKFLEHTFKGLTYSPANITQFAGFPLRWIKRRFHILDSADRQNIA